MTLYIGIDVAKTLRQRSARFVRKTLLPSKSDVYHEAVLKLYLHYYNTVWCSLMS
ncbi:MAG: hypothetical protein J7M16_08165 [Anaerolineae bacterium]|nr:hypothetical protein [Anaerolineae bacterium]